MINEEMTFKKFGYFSSLLKPHSSKRVIGNCDKCGKVRESTKNDYCSLCQSCGSIGKNKGRIHSEEYKQNMSRIKSNTVFTEEWCKKISISKKGKPSNNPQTRQRGKNHQSWKGGVSPLGNLIRRLQENKYWILSIFKRDNYICKKCGVRGGKLVAHHIKKFATILYEFLQFYSQFSPIEDKETLIRLAVTYAPFWDINNGETLCEDCHCKTENFRNNKVTINNKEE